MATPNEPLTTITITLPTTMAAKAEALAESEGRTLSDLLLEAFRGYQNAALDRWWKELDADETRNPHGYTEEDLPRLINEVRDQMTAEEEARNSAKAS